MAVVELNRAIEYPTAPPSARDDRPVRSRGVVWSVAGVVLVECLYALWTTSRGYFWQDDFIDLQALHHLGFNDRLFEQPIFGHFIPGFNVVDYLLSLIVPYHWWLIVLIEVLLFGLSLILLDRLLAILFGSSWLCVALVALAGAFFGLVPSLVWWATALEYLFAIPATLLACLFHVRYLRTGRVRYAVFGAVALALGFAFYDGLFVSVLFIFLMTVLFWPVGAGLHGVMQTIAAHSRAWVCYGIPVLLELGWRFGHPGLYVTGGSATLGQVLGFVGLSWTQTLVPLVFGVDAWVLATHSERVLAGLLGEIVFVAFVVGTIVRRRSAWRAWVLFGPTFLVGAGLVGATRAGTYGPGDASDVKYVALDAFFLAIAAGFALLPVRPLADAPPAAAAQAEAADNRDRRTMRTPRPAWLRAVAVLTLLAVVVLYGTALIFDQDRDSEAVGSHTSRSFFETFATSWATQTSTASRAFLWDTEVNPRVITPDFFPYDTASMTIGRLHPEIPIDAWGGTGYLLRSDGSVERATAVSQARGLVTGPTGCARAGRIAATLDHRLTGAQPRFGLVSYESATGGVATQSGGSIVDFPKGRGTLITKFPPGPLASVVWRLPPRASVCVTAFTVVVPEVLGHQPRHAS